MKEKRKVFIIQSVRGATKAEREFAISHAARLENSSYEVYLPARNTNQNDPVGLRICTDNRKAIANADEIHIIWKKNNLNWFQKLLSWFVGKLQKWGGLQKSEGSYFDFGMSFMAQHFIPDKKIILVNLDMIKPTGGKSFENVLHALTKRSRK